MPGVPNRWFGFRNELVIMIVLIGRCVLDVRSDGGVPTAPYVRAGDVEVEIDGLGRQHQVFGQA